MRKGKRVQAVALLVVMTACFGCESTFAAKYEKSSGVAEDYLQSDAKVKKMYSEAAILMDAKTGEILFQKNAKKKEYPASITKCLTSLVALENNDLNDTITFSKDAVYNVDVGSSSIARDVGEKLTVEQTLYGAMLESANECCNALAEKTAGSNDQFAELMNQKAAELGCVNSHFANPSGLYDKNHYTCPYDMALIVREGLKNDTWRKISSALTYEIGPTNKKEESFICRNHHSFVNGDVLYDTSLYKVEGGKTGYTEKCKNTLVTYAKSNTSDMELICVVMRCDDYYYTMGHSRSRVYTDTLNLLDYGFSNFTSIRSTVDVSKQDVDVSNNYVQAAYKMLEPQPFISFRADNDCEIVVSNTYDASSLQGTVVLDKDDKTGRFGRYEFTSSGNVISATDVYYELNQDMLKELFSSPSHRSSIKKIGHTIVIVILAMLLLVLVYALVRFFRHFSLASIFGNGGVKLGLLNQKRGMNSFKPYKKRRPSRIKSSDYGSLNTSRRRRRRRYGRKKNLHF